MTTFECTSQSIEETKLFITKKFNELNLAKYLYKKNNNGDFIKKSDGEYEEVLGYRSIISFNKNYLIIKEKIYDDDYMIKFNSGDSISYTLINISKLISYDVDIFLSEGRIQFWTKENGIKILNEKEFHLFLNSSNFKFVKNNNKDDNYYPIFFMNPSDLENTKVKTKKAFKHLVGLYGGKIIDELF